MNTPQANQAEQAAVSLFSIVFSFLATSHHWIHMGILFILGGSTNMMAAMSGVLWIRRFMIIVTLITVAFSVYRLYKHRCKTMWLISLTAISVVISMGFIVYTLASFGW